MSTRWPNLTELSLILRGKMNTSDCSTCLGESDKPCAEIYTRVSEEFVAWSQTVGKADVVAYKGLDSAAEYKDYIVDRLRFPLERVGCVEWDNTSFVNSKLTEFVLSLTDQR